MADLKDCKKYADCDWRKSVGYCPDECNHFKHKDEVIVVRCKDCKYYKMLTDYRESRLPVCDRRKLNVEMHEDDFCSYGERKNKGE